MINVSMLAIIGGSSGSGMDESPRSMVVSNADDRIPITESNRATINVL